MGSPILITARPKSSRVRFLSYFRNINKQLERKPYTMPKINETLFKLEGFQYDTSLNLNMGCYHIPFSYNASNLCTIIFPWVKYCYNCLIMGIANSTDIIQQNINDLFRGFKFIPEYIYVILILTKGYCTYHVQKFELTLSKLKAKELKCNIIKSFFE